MSQERRNLSACIIDDDPIYQFTMKSILNKQKIVKDILVFKDGEQALDFFISNIDNDQDLPDVIFLDIDMPIMDGFQFMERYVELKPKVGKKIIIYMVSSSVDPKDIERAKKISEISDYIVKPVEPGKLKIILKEISNTIE